MSKIVINRWLSCLLIVSMVMSGWLTAGNRPAAAEPSLPSKGIPPLLITELVPDTADVGTADGYEFIEVYNNTDRDLDFSHYQIRYRYLESDTLWAHVPNEVTIKPGGTLVFWIINSQNGKATVDDFNRNYGTSLTENENIVKIFSGGMANTRMREVLIATNTGRPVVSALFNDGEVQNEENLGIFYKYPEDGSNRMQHLSFREHKATPGSLEHSTVPQEPVHISDTKLPAIVNKTAAGPVPAGGSLDIAAGLSGDDPVTTLTLSYRGDGAKEYTDVKLQESNQGYVHTIPVLELLGHEKLEYYFTVSNSYKEQKSQTFHADLNGKPAKQRLNVKDQQILSGTAVIRGAADKVSPADLELYIDGARVQGTPSMDDPAYFVFEADGIDDGVNTVTIGKDVLYRTEANIDGYKTLIVPIKPERLAAGQNTITLRAGDNDKTYFEDDKPSGNMDDFNVRNVRLLLGDGTELRDPNHNDPALVHDLGDDGRFLPFVDFRFDIPADRFTALSHAWDTTQAADGPHAVTLKAGKKDGAAVKVLVDNEGPVISSSIEDGRSYKGSFTIEVSAKDDVSGVDTIETKLDGKAIELPYATSSAVLSPGEHVLQVSAKDQAGNRSERKMIFRTPQEHPDTPILIGPADGKVVDTLSPELKVQVNDPTGDRLNVSFHQAHTYNALSGERVKLSKHATDEEPPTIRHPEGETALNGEELEKISASDDRYVTVDSTSQFPYLRFDVELEDDVEPGDHVEVIWEGHTVEGRKVTMYAWNHNTGKWTEITKHIAASGEDFTLRGELTASDYVRDRKADIIVQDEIPSRGDYDYTFVWVSDTQFLTELYPHIQQQQFDWIVDSMDKMNIKYLFHTGDIVNEPTASYQWERASGYMKMLEQAGLPHGVLAGNHDVGSYDWDYTTYSRYFGEDRYQDQPYYGGSYKNNRGHYDLISVEGHDFIMMYMGWGTEDEDIKWMNEVLAEYPDRTAFLSFHDYLRSNGTRSATGNKLYEQVVVPNPNVVAVLSGHYTGANLLKDNIDDDGDGAPDRTVYQMLADYQGHAEGGMGYLRLLHFDTKNDQIFVNTYSPYLDKYNYYTKPGIDEFTIKMDLKPMVKRVATDAIQVNHLKGAAIGTPQTVNSGSEVVQRWEGLQADSSYSWYAVVQDEFGGKTVSNVWTFLTGAAGTNGNEQVPAAPSEEDKPAEKTASLAQRP